MFSSIFDFLQLSSVISSSNTYVDGDYKDLETLLSEMPTDIQVKDDQTEYKNKSIGDLIDMETKLINLRLASRNNYYLSCRNLDGFYIKNPEIINITQYLNGFDAYTDLTGSIHKNSTAIRNYKYSPYNTSSNRINKK